jgi:NDP-sugar pyrophosphorylase family protein
MTISMDVKAAPIEMVVGEGQKKPVAAINPIEDGLYKIETQLGAQNLGLVDTRNAQDGYSVVVFDGKGGLSVILQSPKGLKYFLLPGSQATVGGIVVELSEDGAEETAAGSPHEAQMPASPQRQQITDQAMILGAGIGTRILPLTDSAIGIAKPALPLHGDETVIGAIVKHLAGQGFSKMFVNTFHHRDSVQQALHQACPADCNIIEIPENRATGTAGGLHTILSNPQDYPNFDPSKPILIIQGDAVTNADLTHLVRAHEANNAIVTIGCQVVADADVSKFGIIATRPVSGDPSNPSGPIVSFMEKPSLAAAGPHRLGSTGFYVLSPQLYPIILEVYETKLNRERQQANIQGLAQPNEVEELDFAKDIFPAVLQRVEAGTLRNERGACLMWAEKVDGFWCDIGNPRQYLETLRQLYAGHGGFELPHNLNELIVENVVYWPGTQAIARQEATLAGNILVGKPKR